MERLRTTVIECNYKELNLQLKEALILVHNDNVMLTEIICKLTSIKDTRVVTSEPIIAWASQEELKD